MESKQIFLIVCMVILIVSFCCQIAGIVTDGWLVFDVTPTSRSYYFGLYYVYYCEGDNCSAYHFADLPTANPFGVGNEVLDKIFMVYRVGTSLAGAVTFLAIIFLSRLTTQCCSRCLTCAEYTNHVTCLYCFTLAGGLLAISEAAHYGTEIAARSEEQAFLEAPFSIILTGIGGVLALVAFFMLVIMFCIENDRKEVVAPRKFIPPDQYFEKAEAYVTKTPTLAPAPVTVSDLNPQPAVQTSPPSYSSTRTYSDFLSERPQQRVEYIEMPSTSRSYTYDGPYGGSRYHQIRRTQPNVYHITMTGR